MKSNGKYIVVKYGSCVRSLLKYSLISHSMTCPGPSDIEIA